jgi:hypothetical protein
MGGIAGYALSANKLLAAGQGDPPNGTAMRTLLEEYDALGEHRTAGPGDNATSPWLADKLTRSGYQTSQPSFVFDLFEPDRSEITVADQKISLFPAWPVVETSGSTAQLAPIDAPDIAGKIAVIAFDHKVYTWAQPQCGEPVQAAIARGAKAVLAITEGPTGDIIALNAIPSRHAWTVPVLLAPGREKARLMDAATHGCQAMLISTGKRTPNAKATNVMAHRPGNGKTIVLSTPKSGWFHCASERGSGIAIFLALADWLARTSTADIMCIATSGHEIDGTGGREFLTNGAPTPDRTRLWLHIGANVACSTVTFADGKPILEDKPSAARRITVSASLLPVVQKAFAGQPGYDTPQDAATSEAVGEAAIFRDAGYNPLLGLVGLSPLFHTRIDRAHLGASPALIADVASGLSTVLEAVIQN